MNEIKAKRASRRNISTINKTLKYIKQTGDDDDLK